MVTTSRRRSLPALACALGLLFACGLSWACGGEEEPEAEVAVHISGVNKLAGATQLVAYVFGSATVCSRALANPLDVQQADIAGNTGCNPDLATLCVFSQWNIPIDGGRGRIADVPPGIRTVVVLALDSGGTVIGQGCAEGITVEEKKASPVEIALQPLPVG